MPAVMMVGTDYKSFPMFMSLKCLIEVRAVSLKPNTCCAKKHFDRKVMLYLIERARSKYTLQHVYIS